MEPSWLSANDLSHDDDGALLSGHRHDDEDGGNDAPAQHDYPEVFDSLDYHPMTGHYFTEYDVKDEVQELHLYVCESNLDFCPH